MKLDAITIMVIFTVTLSSIGAEQKKNFTLEVKSDCVKIVNERMSVNTSPRKMNPRFQGPYGNFTTAGINWPLERIEVIENSEKVKIVELISQEVERANDKKAIFSLRLTAKSGYPGIEAMATIKNIGEYAMSQYFFLQLSDLKFPYYYDINGWQYAGKSTLPLNTTWIYTPAAGTIGGYGIIPLNIKKTKITTLFPRKKWQRIGLYFMPRNRHTEIKVRKTFSLGFVIFPTISQWEALEYFEKRRTHGLDKQ